MMKIKAYIFDWGDTLMVDYKDETGPMCKWSKISLCENALETLRELSKCAKCFLATNAEDSTKDEIKLALDKVGILKYVDDIFCFQELKEMKPSKNYFEKMIGILGLKPQQVMVIGDDIIKDYKWALDNEANAVLYDPTKSVNDSKINKINDLLELISKQNTKGE